MKILLHDFGRHAFPAQLSRALAGRGHEVLHLYAGSNNTPMGNLAREELDPAGFTSRALHTRSEYQKYSFIKRWQQEKEYAALLADAIRAYRPDVVLECTGPTDGHRAALQASRDCGARYVYWLQDVNGIAAYNLLKKKIPLVGAGVGRYYIHMEKAVIKGSDRVVLISDDFRPIMAQWGIPPHKLRTIPNWAPIENIPVLPRQNGWSTESGLDGKFCFLYSGSLGLKHKPELLLNLAGHYRHDERVRVVVLSEGLGADWLKEKIAEAGLGNMSVLTYETFARLPHALASADVLVSILQPDAGVYSVPSKVNTYFCAGRPILLAVPPENLAARLVTEAGAGLVADPRDTGAFIRAAGRLLESADLRETCGFNARKFAEKNFDIQTITGQFEEILGATQ